MIDTLEKFFSTDNIVIFMIDELLFALFLAGVLFSIVLTLDILIGLFNTIDTYEKSCACEFRYVRVHTHSHVAPDLPLHWYITAYGDLQQHRWWGWKTISKGVFLGRYNDNREVIEKFEHKMFRIA